MKNILACAFSLVVLLAAAASLSAKGATTKIIINGTDLAAPIEIADPTILRPFDVWAGPGTMSCIRGVCAEGAEGFIIDWAAGVIAQRPTGLRRYTVSFYTEQQGLGNAGGGMPVEEPSYVVLYEYDPAAQRGYVYLPGKDDQLYQMNVKAIFRQREGNWFLATGAWQELAGAFIAQR